MRLTLSANQIALDFFAAGEGRKVENSGNAPLKRKSFTEFSQQEEDDYQQLLQSLVTAPPWSVSDDGIEAVIAPKSKAKAAMATQAIILQKQIKLEEKALRKELARKGIQPSEAVEAFVSPKRSLAFWMARFAGIKPPRYRTPVACSDAE